MNNWTRFIIKCSVSAALLLLPFRAYVCSDYLPDEWRFWLFQPDVAGVSELLPFTYTYEKFYGNEWGGLSPDTTNYAVNASEWQALLGNSVKEADVYKVLYQTSPEDYAAGEIPRNNTFLTALRRPKNVEMLEYLNLAKQCEHVLSGLTSITNAETETVLAKARSLYQKTTDPFVKLRIAYQIMKLRHDEQEMKRQLTYIQKNAPAGAWVRDMALYSYAVSLNPKNAAQFNYTLSLAFDGCRWNKTWLVRYFQPTQLPKAMQLAQNDHERAVLQTMAALQYPGRALSDLEKIYQYDPTYPALSLLLSREINKLENWILTPKLTDKTARFELTYEENPDDRATRDKLLRDDLAYLHQLDQFVNKVLDSGKAPDPGFWRLSAAHLMLLDGDFAKTREQLSKISAPDKLPARLQVQYQVTTLLAEILDSKTITRETENKIPGIFALLEQHKDQIKEADRLQSQLALFLSDAFLQRGSVAKSTLLLSKTRQEWSCHFASRVFYLKLLETAEPADYDALLALLTSKSATPFERWLTAVPIPFDANYWDGEYDDKTGRLLPAKYAGATWDLNVIREFKGKYYIWKDRLDSAYLTLRDIPDLYWAAKDTMYYDSIKNPFSVGIEIPGVALSGEKMVFGRNQARFLKQMLDLQEEAKKDSSKTQLNYLLLGNAYFNMSWMGRFWEVYHTERGSTEFVDVRVPEPVAKTGDTGFPGAPWTFGFGLVGLMLAGLTRARRIKTICLLGSMACVLAGFWNCNRTEPPKEKVTSWTPTISTDFDGAYYCCDRAKAYYIKALETNPNSQLAIVAAYMAGLCGKAREVYVYSKTHPEEYFYDVADSKIKFASNPYLAKLPAGMTYKPATSCAVFRSFLEKEGR